MKIGELARRFDVAPSKIPLPGGEGLVGRPQDRRAAIANTMRVQSKP